MSSVAFAQGPDVFALDVLTVLAFHELAKRSGGPVLSKVGCDGQHYIYAVYVHHAMGDRPAALLDSLLPELGWR